LKFVVIVVTVMIMASVCIKVIMGCTRFYSGIVMLHWSE